MTAPVRAIVGPPYYGPPPACYAPPGPGRGELDVTNPRRPWRECQRGRPKGQRRTGARASATHTPVMASSPKCKLRKTDAVDQGGNVVTIPRLPFVVGSNKPPGWIRWRSKEKAEHLLGLSLYRMHECPSCPADREVDQGGLEKASPFSLRDQWFESISLQRRESANHRFHPHLGDGCEGETGVGASRMTGASGALRPRSPARQRAPSSGHDVERQNI